MLVLTVLSLFFIEQDAAVSPLEDPASGLFLFENGVTTVLFALSYISLIYMSKSKDREILITIYIQQDDYISFLR